MVRRPEMSVFRWVWPKPRTVFKFLSEGSSAQMARRADVVCAGGCGKLMWGGSTSLPEGQATCRSCRRLRLPGPGCANCGGAKKDRSKFCSSACANRANGEVRKGLGPDANELARRRDQRKRAIKRGVASDDYTRAEIGDRDGWMCGICAAPVDPSLIWPHPQSPSVDHIQPLSLGGDNTRGNVRIAHLVCNTRRGNRVAQGAA